MTSRRRSREQYEVERKGPPKRFIRTERSGTLLKTKRLGRLRIIVRLVTAVTALSLVQPAPASAVTYTEWNTAVASGPPPSGTGGCDWHYPPTGTTTWDAYVCFIPYGDYFYVYDRAPDGKSAVAYWTHWGGTRTGACRNSLGAGKWGVCNKNLDEGIVVSLRAGTYDAETRTIDDSGNTVWIRNDN